MPTTSKCPSCGAVFRFDSYHEEYYCATESCKYFSIPEDVVLQAHKQEQQKEQA